MITEFYLPKNDCLNICNFVYQEKDKWEKDLNNVKSLTSGFNPDFKFMHDIGDFVCNEILPKTTKHDQWKKDYWWINFYQKGNYTLPHNHKPEEYSMIIIIKPSISNCLYMKINEKILQVKEKQGLSLLFNSTIPHEVRPVDSDRITIAMDFVKNQ